MIPDSLRNPRDHFTLMTEAKARDLVARFAQTDPGEDYRAEPKGAGYAIAYYDAGEFVAYL
uniref:GNAT family N-acetyltransferase n=1 Tax=Caulobacter phage BL57 TaxID=3348355 RepID=A0AB74UMY6_9VIRU